MFRDIVIFALGVLSTLFAMLLLAMRKDKEESNAIDRRLAAADRELSAAQRNLSSARERLDQTNSVP